jgi:hypothetical protein
LGTRGNCAFEFGNARNESGLGLVQKVLFVGEGRMTSPVDFRPDGWSALSGRRELRSGEAMKGRLVRNAAALPGNLNRSEDVEEVLSVSEARRKTAQMWRDEWEEQQQNGDARQWL